MSYRSERGVTLIELMIGLVLGLVVVGMVTTMYISTIGILSQTSSTIRLNSELRAVNELISRSVKRAGYWAGNQVASNPHASVIAGPGGMQVGIFDSSDWSSPKLSGDCVVVSYDADSAGQLTPIEVFGVRLLGSVIQVTSTATVAAGPVTCASLTWDDLTDKSFVSVSDFSISYLPLGVSLVSIASLSSKSIQFEITGLALDDPDLSQTVSGAVNLRNSRFW